jgi:L-asparaginase II
VPVVAEVTRSGIVESRHHGHVAALDATGSLVLAVGDVTMPVFGRSSNKPLQAVAMLRRGLLVDDEELALVTASHSGEPRHLAIVRRVLRDRGLRVEDLANTPAFPLNERCARDIVRAGGSTTSLTQNCSGKHAGMLATCVVNGWPLDSYLDTDHPLQYAITEVFAELAAARRAHRRGRLQRRYAVRLPGSPGRFELVVARTDARATGCRRHAGPSRAGRRRGTKT